MKAQPRLPEIDARLAPVAPIPKPLRTAAAVVADRLASTGYAIDAAKCAAFVQAGFVSLPDDSLDHRAALGRLTQILEIERRLAPWSTLDALAFHLAAEGIEGIPAAAVGRHVAASLMSLYALGDRLIAGMQMTSKMVGPLGEWQVARSMARFTLRDIRLGGRTEAAATETLLAAAFVAYVKSSWSNPRPERVLHRSSRLVNLEAETEERPRQRRDGPLPPLVERRSLAQWVQSCAYGNGVKLFTAVRSAGALVRLNACAFPELQRPWRDAALQYGANGSAALAAVMLVAPVMAAAYAQNDAQQREPSLDRTLAALMNGWGTVSTQTVRFDLSNGSFPWVQRAGIRSEPA